MSKNIILLSDGTGRSNVLNRGTNVFKLYEALDFKHTTCKQVAFYGDGVGSQGFKPQKILGGISGWGLASNIRYLYKALVQSYQQGDKIYLFGFSRGAFTVRTLAGFIAHMGILDAAAYLNEQQLDWAVWRCYQQYRALKMAVFEKLFFERFYKLQNDQLIYKDPKPVIEFIGAWDTVDAVGLPSETLTNIWNQYIFRFKLKDHLLHERVKQACHALAIDDERQIFAPLLWIEDPRIEQVWFPGAHGNVGGGYPQQGISLVTLDWMMTKAKAAGLQFTAMDEDFVNSREYAFDKLYNSRAGLNVYYRYKPRNIAKICADNRITTPKLHISVFNRIAQGIFSYAPGNLPNTFEVVDHTGQYSQSENLADLVKQVLSDLSPSCQSLLDQVAPKVKARRLLYGVFLGFSLLTLWILVRADLADPAVGWFGTLKILVSPDGLLDKLAVLLWQHPLWVLIGLMIFATSTYIRGSMEDIFTEFWSKLRPKLNVTLRLPLF